MPHPPDTPTTAHGFVREGWHHLRLQRPLAAWASWQRALRLDPDDAAAVDALETLAHSPELPAAARAVYRFVTPGDGARRARWDARLRDGGLDDPAAAAGAFAGLAEDDPLDADARLNRALCLAWLGRNAEAVADLDRVVGLAAGSDPTRAADAWVLAEVLRLGAGAEALADDFRYSWSADWLEGPGPPPGLLRSWPGLSPVDLPADPAAPSGVEVFDWLDRPAPDPAAGPTRADALPRVLAAVICTPKYARLSNPDPSGFARLDDPEFAPIRRALGPPRREKSPLPIAWADAGLATFRFPPGLDPDARAGLARDAVEHYFEDLWVLVPRQALGGLRPVDAARAAAGGDAVLGAKLAGVVRFREQLGVRPSHAGIYLGYPFDRLRRRLGLLAPGDGAVDADDLSCASTAELDGLDPAGLDDRRLADAFASAAPLGDDPRTARFAAEVARRGPAALAGLDPSAVFAPLVREALRAGDPPAALSWLARAREVVPGPAGSTFVVWSAEVLARSGHPEAALRLYRERLDDPDAGADVALDGAGTLLDNGHPEQALPLLLEARDRATASGDREALREAERLLGPR